MKCQEEESVWVGSKKVGMIGVEKNSVSSTRTGPELVRRERRQSPGEVQHYQFWRTKRSGTQGPRRRDVQRKRTNRKGLSRRPGTFDSWSLIWSGSFSLFLKYSYTVLDLQPLLQSLTNRLIYILDHTVSQTFSQ